MITELNWKTYLKLNDYIESKNFIKEFFTPICLVSWLEYGIKIKFNIIDDNVVLYLMFDNNYLLDENKLEEKENITINNYWYVSTIFYSNITDINLLKEKIKEDLMILNGSNIIKYNNIPEHMIEDFSLNRNNVIELNYISNYIYDLQSLKTFAGKKLQKKRNHLNYFINQKHNLTIKNLKDVDLKIIFDFLDRHMNKYADSYRQYEIDVYKNYLYDGYNESDRYFGTAIFIDNVLVAFTFCYLHKDTCEIIIEKAEQDIRGLYQYIIKINLEFHNINVKYLDRQDDAGIESLKKSKDSYYPLMKIKRFKCYN